MTRYALTVSLWANLESFAVRFFKIGGPAHASVPRLRFCVSQSVCWAHSCQGANPLRPFESPQGTILNFHLQTLPLIHRPEILGRPAPRERSCR